MSDKKQATASTEKKNEVKDQAAKAKEARQDVKQTSAPTEKSEKKEAAPKPAPEPQFKEVGIYKLTEKATTEFEKMKGQRKLMVAAFVKAGKPVGAHELQPFFEDLSALTKQDPQAVIEYHCLKMLDDGYLIETGKVKVEVPKRQRKAKEAPASAETSNTGQASA